MKILNTNIPDFNEKNIDLEKINLSDKVIESVYPYLNDDFNKKVKEIKLIRINTDKTKDLLNKEKEQLDKLMNEYNNKKKIKTYLDRIMKLIGSNLLVGNVKEEILKVLNIIETSSSHQLDSFLNDSVLNVLNSKNSKN